MVDPRAQGLPVRTGTGLLLTGKWDGGLSKGIRLSWRIWHCRKLVFVSLYQGKLQHLTALLLLLKANGFLMSYPESWRWSGHETKIEENNLSVSLPAPLAHFGELFPLLNRDTPKPASAPLTSRVCRSPSGRWQLPQLGSISERRAQLKLVSSVSLKTAAISPQPPLWSHSSEENKGDPSLSTLLGGLLFKDLGCKNPICCNLGLGWPWLCPGAYLPKTFHSCTGC